MSKITVLVAVYNAKPYLSQCVGSLMGQTLSDFQAVLVDDCSTDGSAQLLDDYAQRDPRLTVIHLDENHGQAYARNRGIDVATGQYITTLDADDWLSADALELAVAAMEEHSRTDAVLFDLRLCYPDGREEPYSWHFPTKGVETYDFGGFKMMTGRSAFLASISWQIHGFVAARRELFEQYPFDTTLSSYSDDNAVRLQLRAAREVRCCRGKYFYRQHDTSVTHLPTTSRMNWMGATTLLRQELRQLGETDQVLGEVEWQRWLTIVDSGWFLYRNRHYFTPSQRLYCIKRIHDEWAKTDTRRLPLRKKLRPGFYPFRGCWPLFQAEEWLLFTTKRILRKQ